MITLDTDGVTPGTPLSKWLTALFPAGRVQRAFRKKGVRVNGKQVRETALIGPGDTVTLHIAMADPPWKPEILTDRPDLVIINKPAGAVVQQNDRLTFEESLEGRVYGYFRSLNREAFLVHRLDRDTSGCLLFACNPETLKSLKALFGTGDEEKTYLALVKGLPERDSGTLTNKLPGRDGVPVPALTEYTVQERFPAAGVSLIRARIRTGRLHQIRLHCAGWGHPVVLDREHGDFGFNKDFQKRTGLKRMFLHAWRLSFTHGRETLSTEAPLPTDLAGVLDRIRRQA